MKPLCFLAGLLLFIAAARAGDVWPQFRGPEGNGHSEARGLPLTWSETEHVRWKTPVHGRAWSSPVIWGRQVWCTTATEDGTKLFAICVDWETGRMVHDIKLFDVEKPQFAIQFNTYASPTPVIDEGRVYVTFGSPGTACLDTQTGQVLWERRDFVCNHFRGAGSSPILHSNLLFLNFDGSDLQYVVALDKKTGQTVWKTNRSIDHKDLGPDGKPKADGDFRKAFSTPHVAVLDGRETLLSLGSKAAYAYEPATGRELWRLEERANYSASQRPLVAHGLVFMQSGWSSGQLLAVRPGKPGEVADANVAPPLNSTRQLDVVWQTKRNVARKPGLLVVQDQLFMLDDGGIASCFEAKTGRELWRERVGGNYSASPLEAEGHIYCFSEEGKATVLQAGAEFKKLGENTLPDGFMASPAVVGQALCLRTKKAIYRIEAPKP